MVFAMRFEHYFVISLKTERRKRSICGRKKTILLSMPWTIGLIVHYLDDSCLGQADTVHCSRGVGKGVV
jgi:hypothetical protein